LMTKTKRDLTLMLLMNESLYTSVSRINWRRRKNSWRSNSWRTKQHKIKKTNESKLCLNEKKEIRRFWVVTIRMMIW
jgi:hypothetical protein